MARPERSRAKGRTRKESPSPAPPSTTVNNAGGGKRGKRGVMTHPKQVREPVERLLSLDVARGITIAFMIMVNNNGGSGSWRFMNHAAWNGLTATDLVFPTFVFVM